MNAPAFIRSLAVTREVFGSGNVIERNRQRLIVNGARQESELVALRDAIDAALETAATSMGGLWSTHEGYSILSAVYDLTECDDVLSMAREAALDAGVDVEAEEAADRADYLLQRRRDDAMERQWERGQ